MTKNQKVNLFFEKLEVRLFIKKKKRLKKIRQKEKVKLTLNLAP